MNKCSFRILVITILLFAKLSFPRKVTRHLEPCSAAKPTYTSITLKETEDTDDCYESENNDFSKRNEKKHHYTNCKIADTWGAWPKLFDHAHVPKNCDKEKWMRGRILKAIRHIVNKKYNYCHHHSPDWTPPKDKDSKGHFKYRTLLDSKHIAQGKDKGVCSSSYFTSTNAKKAAEEEAGWHGIDCSHFSCYTYNFAFGAFLNTNVSVQACDNSPEARAVSSFLPFTRDDQDKFKAGDLLYIAKNSKQNPLSISHVIIWTGHKLGDEGYSEEKILENLDPSKKKFYLREIKKSLKNNKPVYIIADSHYIGPNYRPFLSWYYEAFSHARRIIGKEEFDQQEPKDGTVLTKKGCKVPK